MKVIIENHIPYIKGVIEPFAQVEYLSNKDITPCAVKDADALIVRTRTICNESLLAGSRCRFIGTATIGTDHIDLDYCSSHGILVFNAPGCNAPAVAQYVISTIGYWCAANGITRLSDKTLGIVGVGHVGSIIARWAEEVGLKILLNDPIRAISDPDVPFVPLDHMASHADIITFHTPFTTSGKYKTLHLCDTSFLASLKHCGLLINSARGGIVDNAATLKALDSGLIGDVVIDCWENEPDINLELLNRAFVATPHIAGYSAQGKTRATAMILEAMSRHFGWKLDIPAVNTPLEGAENVTMERIMDSYNPVEDSMALRQDPSSFESLRNNYLLRQEV